MNVKTKFERSAKLENQKKESVMKNNRMSITEVAQQLDVTPKTIMRWEKSGKVKKSKRDWRGWRFYTDEDLERLKSFKEAVFIEGDNGGR